MFNLDNLKIRTKLIALLFVPVVALLIFASVGWSQRNDIAAQASGDERIVAAAAATSDLIAAMQHEAVATVASIADPDAKVDLPALQEKTDTAATKFEKANDELDLNGDSTAVNDVSSALSTLQARLTSFTGYRDHPDDITWQEQLGNYRINSIDSFVEYVQDLAKLTSTPEVVLPLEQLASLLDYNLQTTSLGIMAFTTRVSGEGVWAEAPADSDVEPNQVAVYDLAVEQDKKNAVLTRVAGSSGPISSYFDKSVSMPADLDFIIANDWQVQPPMSESPFSSERSDMAFPSLDVALDDVQTYVTQLGLAATDLTERTADRIETQRSDAVRNAQLYALAGFLAIVIAIAAAIVIARSITQRLNKLTDAADRLSHEQLPRLVDSLKNPAEDDVSYLTSSFTEIDDKGSDEIGQLAGAFNRIQGVAVDVATEQAQLLRKGIGDMFVNLARRNQGLLDRQIEFIDELEAAEEDPDQLENLFRLDHLATRMRRNAESLLVLAGAEPSRRRGKPVPLADVVRAAVGEVEDFSRIDMLQFDEVLVASNAALDIAHLLSELMENATNFSAPDTRVEVVGHRTKAEGYVISVTDHGIGMPPEAFAEANDLLARPPLVGLALSRSLGFIVIGRLAARFGIAVRLMPAPSSGTTAMVSLPPSLITDQPRIARGPGELTETGDEAAPPAPTEDTPIRKRRGPGQTPARTAPRAERGPSAAPAGPMPRRTPDRADAQGGQAPTAPRATPATAPPTTPASAPPATPASAPPATPASAPRATPATAPAASTGPVRQTGPTRTAAGLTKRVPRAAGGERAVPGGDGKRAATQNRRSPDEVRSMLSQYRSGMQKGRAEDDQDADGPAPTPKDDGK